MVTVGEILYELAMRIFLVVWLWVAGWGIGSSLHLLQEIKDQYQDAYNFQSYKIYMATH